MDDPIERVIDDIRRYRAATAHLIESLQRQVSSSDTDIAKLRAGTTMEAKIREAASAALAAI